MIPMYRAKRIDSNEWVEGYLFIIWDKYYILWGTTNNIPNQIEINPSTLAISFNNGKSWLKLEDLEVYTCTDFDLKYNDMKY